MRRSLRPVLALPLLLAGPCTPVAAQCGTPDSARVLFEGYCYPGSDGLLLVIGG